MTTIITTLLKNYIACYSGLEKKCWQGIIINFIESTLIGVFYFLPLYFINELNFSLSTSGIIISCFGMGTILGGYFGGKLSDQFSPRSVSTSSLFIQSGVFFALIHFKTQHALMVALFFMGIASYGFITSNYLWVLKECQKNEAERAQALNMLNMASNLGLGLSAVLVSSFMRYGFSYLLTGSAILLFLVAMYFYLLTKNDVLNSTMKTIEINSVTQNNYKLIILMLFCLFLVGLIIFQSSNYSIYIQETFPKQGVNAVGFLFAMNTFLVVLTQTPLGHFSQPYKKLHIAGMGAFLLGFGLLLLALSTSFELAIFANVIYTIGEMLFFSVSQSICYENCSFLKKGQMLGIYRMVYALSRVVGPAAGALIYQQWGANQLWYMCCALGCFCLLACLTFPDKGLHKA